MGRVLFDQKPLVYLAVALLALTAWLLYRTRVGLAVRAAGDMPDAVAANGLSVRGVRWFASTSSPAAWPASAARSS